MAKIIEFPMEKVSDMKEIDVFSYEYQIIAESYSIIREAMHKLSATDAILNKDLIEVLQEYQDKIADLFEENETRR